MGEPSEGAHGRIAYFDCFSGISGDMALGTLIDAGLSAETLRSELAKLAIPGLDVEVQRVSRRGFVGTQVSVVTSEPHAPPRRLADIEAIIGASELAPLVQSRAIATFRRLGEVEAAVHGVSIDEVHFHEVGAADAIVDVVGFAIGLEHLAIERCYASSLPMGHGMVQSAHGLLPLPAPATLALLAGVSAPLHHLDVEAELVTPTGAALLAANATFERPPMRIQRVGIGVGARELPWPNALRLWLGEAVADAAPDGFEQGECVVIETNLDDTTPEEVAFAMERLFAAGALDVFLTPAQMKKNRPGIQLTVLASPTMASTLARAILRETTSLGVRYSTVQRVMCPRRPGSLWTRFGEIAVKIKTIDGADTICPEYEACARVAREQGVPIRQVYAAVLAAGAGGLPELTVRDSDRQGGRAD
jgi:uncharacterized protein (TIGR00299 family) protein